MGKGIRHINAILAELIDIDTLVAQNRYGDSVAIALPLNADGRLMSGFVESLSLISTVDGTGSVQEVTGSMFFFNADPVISAADTDMTAAAWATVLARVDVVEGDWVAADANGGVATFHDQHIAFPALSQLFAVWFHTLAASFNGAGADNEQLELNIHIKKEMA